MRGYTIILQLFLFYQTYCLMAAQNFYRIFKDEGLSFGRKIAKKEVMFFLQIFLLMFVAEMIPTFINWMNHAPYEANNIGNVIAPVVGAIFAFGLIKIFLHFVHEKKTDLKDLWDHDRMRFLWWILSRIAHGIIVFVGTLLLIVPGIYFAARLYLYEYYVVDQKLNAKEALQASWRATK